MASKEESLRNLIEIHENNPGLINLAYIYGSYIAMGYDVCDIKDDFTTIKGETPVGEKVRCFSNTAKRKGVSNYINNIFNFDIERYIENLKLTNNDVFYVKNIEQALAKYKNNPRACFSVLLKQSKSNENVRANISKLSESKVPEIKIMGELLDSSLNQVLSENTEEKTILNFDSNSYDKFIESIRPNPGSDKFVCMLGNIPATVGGKSLEEARVNAKEVFIRSDVNKNIRQASASKEKDSAPVKNF